MNKTLQIENYLDYLYPNPPCMLNYTKDYELLIAILLSAQTTDKMVNKVTNILFNKYKSLEELSCANYNDVMDILRPLGNFRKKASYVISVSSILHNNYNDIVPKDREILESLPGVGRKTVNVFFIEYYSESIMAVDTHVDRVSKRLGLASKDDSVLEVEKKLSNKLDKNKLGIRHKQLVLFGRYVCTSRNPKCSECKLNDICKYYKKGIIK